MSMTSEGTVYIPFEEFWEFVGKYNSQGPAEVAYGVPRVVVGNNQIEIDFAASTEGHPFDWAVKPKAVLQWEELKKSSSKATTGI